jgi:hypothetical protein
MRDLENERAVAASAIVGGDRAADNERKLHEALRTYAASLPSQALSGIRSDLFASFLIGGFECSTHRHQHGRRLDLIAATGHDTNAESDYRMLAEHGIRTVRDGLRWHLIEEAPGHYDWSSFLRTISTSGSPRSLTASHALRAPPRRLSVTKPM